jgi:hypothetical protein
MGQNRPRQSHLVDNFVKSTSSAKCRLSKNKMQEILLKAMKVHGHQECTTVKQISATKRGDPMPLCAACN